MESVSGNGVAMIFMGDSSKLLIVIASSDTNLRQRWGAMLQTGPYIVNEAAGRLALERLLLRLKPFLLFYDLSLSPRGGSAEVSRVRRLSPHTKVIAFTPTAHDDEGIAVLNAGAQGYCQHDIDDTLVPRAVEAVRRGEIWTSRRLVSSLLHEFQSTSQRLQAMIADHTPLSPAPLTSREYEVGSLLSRGASNREIARELGLAERTVKAHVTAMFRKIGVSDRVRLALLMNGQPIAPDF